MIKRLKFNANVWKYSRFPPQRARTGVGVHLPAPDVGGRVPEAVFVGQYKQFI